MYTYVRTTTEGYTIVRLTIGDKCNNTTTSTKTVTSVKYRELIEKKEKLKKVKIQENLGFRDRVKGNG